LYWFPLLLPGSARVTEWSNASNPPPIWGATDQIHFGPCECRYSVVPVEVCQSPETDWHWEAESPASGR
jgi:hypothetical protein